jgi:hypothetical protein
VVLQSKPAEKRLGRQAEQPGYTHTPKANRKAALFSPHPSVNLIGATSATSREGSSVSLIHIWIDSPPKWKNSTKSARAGNTDSSCEIDVELVTAIPVITA